MCALGEAEEPIQALKREIDRVIALLEPARGSKA